MTPIEVIKNMNFCGLCTTGICEECDKKIAKDEAIKALEEKQKDLIYEEQAMKIQPILFDALNELLEYRKIGTLQECKMIVEKYKEISLDDVCE